MFPCSHVPRDFSEIAASPRRLAVIAADSILQPEGGTLSRRHERGCLLNGSGRAYHGVARDSVCLIEAGEPVTAARVIRYLSCHEDRLYHGGKRAPVSIVAASIAARYRVPGGLWSCPGWVCGHLLGLRSLSGSWSLVMSWGFCGHLLGLWSSPGSWAVVISWVCGHLRSLWSFPMS